jgi:hypothetical protein
VNYLLLNACAKTTKCLSCEIFLTTSGYRRIQDPTEIKHWKKEKYEKINRIQNITEFKA